MACSTVWLMTDRRPGVRLWLGISEAGPAEAFMPTSIPARTIYTSQAVRSQVERDRMEAVVLFLTVSLLTALVAVISNTQGVWL